MAETETSLANLALAIIGSPAIDDIDDATSSTARAAKDLMQDVIDEVLSSHDWDDARTYKRLTPESGSPVSELWEYIYKLPTNPWCLVPRRIESVDDNSTWELVYGREIHTNWADHIILIYTARIVTIPYMSPVLTKAIAARLAADLAVALKGKESKQSSALQQYEWILRRAQTVDANKRRAHKELIRDIRKGV